MSTTMSDFARPLARGASVPPPGHLAVPAARPEPPADEAALVGVLRIINRVGRGGTLSAVERAFVLGAKALFEELAEVCEHLLERPPAPAAAEAGAAYEQPAPAPAAPALPRRSRRPTPGGAEQVEPK